MHFYKLILQTYFGRKKYCTFHILEETVGETVLFHFFLFYFRKSRCGANICIYSPHITLNNDIYGTAVLP